MADRKKPSGSGGKARDAKPGTRAPSARSRGAAAKTPDAPKAPRGARTSNGRRKGETITAAQQALRDTLMVSRQAQGWRWKAIAAEAGISERAAKRAVVAAKKEAPLQLNVDPIRLVEDIATGYQLAIGDFEALASAAAVSGQLNAAVGAKKGALDAREKLLLLAQATGRLPQDLGVLRHLLDLRAIGEGMMRGVESFEEQIAALKLSKKERAAVDRAAAQVRATFAELAGLEEPEKPALPAAA